MKKRIDVLLVERGLAESRQKAQALLLAGHVLAGEQKVEKPGQLVDDAAALRLVGMLPFASRAGAKLEAALDAFHIPVKDRICADLGASTGGFTDCLLQRGAREVHAFDVGKGQLDWRLRSDPRVIVHDGYNVRYISAGDLPDGISLVTVDLSFISLTRILQPLREALSPKNPGRPIDLVLLVKPQFEAGKGEVGKGGIVRDARKRAETLSRVGNAAVSVGFRTLGSIASPIAGAKGNQEFLLYLNFDTGLSS